MDTCPAMTIPHEVLRVKLIKTNEDIRQHSVSFLKSNNFAVHGPEAPNSGVFFH